MSVVLALWRHRTIIVAGLLLAAAAFFAIRLELAQAALEAQQAKTAKAIQERDLARETSEANATAAMNAHEERQRTVQLLAQERAAFAAREASLRKLQRDIANAPESENRPAGPILRRTLNGLRREPAAAPH
jgi:hypothetical protein